MIVKVKFGEWQPKIIDFNKACEINTSKIKEITVSERARLKFVIKAFIWLLKLLKQRN